MNIQGGKQKDKILAALINQFPGSLPTIIDVSEDTFRYQLEKNGNYSYFLVNYSIDPSDNLKVDWKSAEPFML
jgi:hypothetical protein